MREFFIPQSLIEDLAALPPEALLNPRQIASLVPVSRMSLLRWEKAGSFPRRICIHKRNFWRVGDVRQWLADKAAEQTAERVA